MHNPQIHLGVRNQTVQKHRRCLPFRLVNSYRAVGRLSVNPQFHWGLFTVYSYGVFSISLTAMPYTPLQLTIPIVISNGFWLPKSISLGLLVANIGCAVTI